MGEADQRIVARQGNSLICDGLQLRELIGAASEEALAQRGEGIGGDGVAPELTEAVFKQKAGRGGMEGGTDSRGEWRKLKGEQN
ncbi:hypothetical protein [Mesorhizobium sp. RIZ17]|uniref:hypothetical protein n=1 Tax=Mesorhizobium sp. RIZ17 TaxID=3132743 RepID=UPI003DA9335F